MSLLADLAEKYENPQVDMGYVYLMEFKFKQGKTYTTLYKVGVTVNDPIDRMLQVSRSFFMGRRYVPECRIVRMRKTIDFYGKEKAIHSLLSKYNYVFKKSFDGSTEFFDIDLEYVDNAFCDVVPKLSDVKIEAKLPK